MQGGKGIKFNPPPRLAGIRGNGIYLCAGSSVYNGEGLLLGRPYIGLNIVNGQYQSGTQPPVTVLLNKNI